MEQDKHLLLYSTEALREVDWDAMRQRAAAFTVAARAEAIMDAARAVKT